MAETSRKSKKSFGNINMIKILQILNKDVPVFDYRAHLYKLKDFHIEFIVPPTEKSYKNIKKYHIDLSEGFDLIKEIKSLINLYIFLLKHRYGVLHWYSTKYYVLGPILAIFTFHFKNIITVNGFGRIFTSDKYKYLKPIFISLFLISSLIVKKIILQNIDDLSFSKKILPKFLHKKLCLVYSGVSLNDNCVDVKKNPFKVINISRIMTEKGIEEFLNIAYNVKEKNNSIEFLIIGGSSGNKTLDQKILKYKNKGILDYIPYTDKPIKYLLNSNILLFTSFREGLPRVILEAFSVNLPVFAYNVFGVRDIISNNKNGKLFRKMEIDAIVDEILKNENNRDSLQMISNNITKEFEQKFSMSKYLEVMNKIYLEVYNA